MGLAQPTHDGPTSEEHGADPQLADALDRLLGALDGLAARDDDEAPPQGPLSDGGGGARPRPETLGFLHLLGARLRHSQRRPYRLTRLISVWLAVGCLCTGIALVLSWVLSLA